MTRGLAPTVIIASIKHSNGNLEEIARSSGANATSSGAWLNAGIQDRHYVDNPALDRRYLVDDMTFSVATGVLHVIFHGAWLTRQPVRLSTVSDGEIIDHAMIGLWCRVRRPDHDNRYLETLWQSERVDWPKGNPKVRRVVLVT